MLNHCISFKDSKVRTTSTLILLLFLLVFVGAWPSQPDDGNLINSSDLSWSRDVFAIGDELGYIRLFRFPCSQPGVSKPTLWIPLLSMPPIL